MTNNLGFIGGGQMAEALIKGIISAGVYISSQLYIYEPNAERSAYMHDQYGIGIATTLEELLQKCNSIIFAVKPQIIQHVVYQVKKHYGMNHLLITIAAGVPLSFYESILGKRTKLIRVMPNTPCLVQEGASAICCNTNVTEWELDITLKIFRAVGKAIVLDEVHLDSATGLSGSGPAYVFTFLEALIDAGVKTGLTREASEILSAQTILGSIQLYMKNNEHPAELKGRVTSPGGTSIAGLHVLEKEGFRGIIMDAVEAATNRSKELGKS
jgi:pyrroline-5-carboxylate reductase